MNLFYNTNLCALRNIDAIYPKTNDFLGNLVSWKPPPINNAFIITSTRLLVFDFTPTKGVLVCQAILLHIE